MMKRMSWVLTIACCITLTLLSTGCPTTVDPPPGQPVDTDADGVIDDDDQCPGTPANETANSEGCSVAQLNTDNDDDGVVDADDLCLNTLAGETVNSDGCSAAQLVSDSDGDGVDDDSDLCPDTPAGDVVDTDGCTVTGGRDRDGDGILDEDDNCPNTPAGNTVDSFGCTITGGGSVCGNGVVEGSEACDTGGESATCDSDCTAVTCGDNMVNVTAGEECDPPDGSTCDSSCHLISDGNFTADQCADALRISGEGVFDMNNSSATLDGPSHAECSRVVCGSAGLCEDQIDLDVWAIWTSPCTATVFVKTCGLTEVDTRIAAYDGSACPTGDDSLLACNDDRCDLQSQVTFEAVTGQDYLIRVGAFPGELGGAGSVSITCSIDACPGEGSCFETCIGGPNDGQSCNSISDCRSTFCVQGNNDGLSCAIDGDCPGGLCKLITSYCQDGTNDGQPCTVDNECPFGTCATVACGGNGSPGCDDESCCETVCNNDPFCCDSEWDDTCAQEAAGLCSGSFDTCVATAGDCTIAKNPICRGGVRDTLPCADDSDCPNGGCMAQPPGCGDVDCCNTVCMDDPFCCIDTWDEFCVAAEPVSCYLSCGPGRGDCFAPRTINSEEAGCEDVSCCEQVCARDPFCCGVEWDETCVEKAVLFCTP